MCRSDGAIVALSREFLVAVAIANRLSAVLIGDDARKAGGPDSLSAPTTLALSDRPTRNYRRSRLCVKGAAPSRTLAMPGLSPAAAL
jgi:hypothetical protein